MAGETRDTTSVQGGRGGTVTTNEVTGQREGTPQRMRVWLPTGDCEVVLGLNDDNHLGIRAKTVATVQRTASNSVLGTMKSDETSYAYTRVGLGVNEKGFVGVIATAAHGNVLLCATGAADVGTDFNHATRVGSIIESGINLTRTGLMLWGARYNAGHAAHIPHMLGFAQVGWSLFNAVTSPFSGDPASGLGNMDYLKTGHVTLFGARSVKLESIEGVSSSAALFNSHSAGLSASLNSIVTASVNSGFLASVNGAFSASINGQTASVVGGADAGVSSRVGNTRIEGRTIRIGNRKQAGKKAAYLSGIQEATEDVWVRGSEFIEIAVPVVREKPEHPAFWPLDGHLIGTQLQPNGMQVMRSGVRINSDLASVRVGSGVTSLAGNSVLRVGPKGIEIARVKKGTVTAANATMAAARITYNLAWGASEGIVKQLGALSAMAKTSKLKIALGTVVAGAGSALGAGMGHVAGDAHGEAGRAEGAALGAITGAVVGVAGVATAMTLIAMKTAGLVQRAGQAAAKKAFFAATDAAKAAEGTMTIIDPTAPKIEVKDSHILITVGPPGVGSSIKVSAAGVEIKGMKLTVNDMTIGPPMVPAPPAVPIIEVDLPAPPVGGVPDADSPIALAMA